MDRVPDDIFNDLMLDVSGSKKWPTMAASDLQGLSGPQLQICKSDFLGKEQRPSDANRGMVHQNEGSTSFALRIDSQRSGIPMKSNEQASNSQSLASAKDAKNDVIFLGYASRTQSGNPTESNKQASISPSVPWRMGSKQNAPSLKLAVNPQLGFPSLTKDQMSSSTEISKQVSSGRPPPWRLDSRQDTPSLTLAGHPQSGFPAIIKEQAPNIYSSPWSMDTSKGASSTQDTHFQQSGFPAVSKGQTSTIYPLPLSANSSNKGASSIHVTHIKRSVIPPGSKGQAPNSFQMALSLDSSKGTSSIKDNNVHQVGPSGESKGQSSLALSLALAKQLSLMKQADPLQSGTLAKSLGQPSSSRTELKGKDHVQVTSSSGFADHQKSGSPAPRIAKAGIAHVMYETIMQEMVGSYEVTEESLAKMTILGIPKPDPTKPTRRKHCSTSRSRSPPRSSGRDAKSSHSSSFRRRSRSPYYRSSYRTDRDRRRRRSSSSSSLGSEGRRRRDRRNRSRSGDGSSRRNRSRNCSRSRNRSRSRNQSRKKADDLDKKTKKKEEAAPPAKTPTIAMIGKKPVDPEVVKVIRTLLAYNFKSWRVKDYQGEKPEFWYLFDESSVEYQYYRLKLSELQKLKKSIKDATVQGDSCQTSSEEFSNESMRAVALAKELAELKEKIVQGQVVLQKQTATAGMQTGLDHVVQELPADVVQPSQSQSVQEQTIPCVEQSTDRQVPAGEAKKPEVRSVEAEQSTNRSAGAEKPKSAASGAPEESTSFQLQFPELDASTRETAENLARFLVEVGPEIDGGFNLGIISENPEFWFLNEKESPAYKFYHMTLTAFCQSSGVAYDSIDSSSQQKAATQDADSSSQQKAATQDADSSSRQKVATQDADSSSRQNAATQDADSSSRQKAATQDAKPQPSKYQDPGPSSLKPPVNKVYESEIIEILDSDSEDSGSQKSDRYDSEPLVAESQDSEPEEPEPKVSEPKGFEMQGTVPERTEPKESKPQGFEPQEPVVNQHSELQGSRPYVSEPDETDLFVTCCSEDDQSDSEDRSPPKTQDKVELRPVVPLDGGLQAIRPKDLHEQPKEGQHNRDLQSSPLLVVEPQSTPPKGPKNRPEVLQPRHPVCRDGLEPMTDVVFLQPLEESENEAAESTASEEAAQSASPAQPSPRRKRGRPVVVAPVPSKRFCAEEETTGLEPMTDVVSLQPLEGTENEEAESTASEEAAQSASPAQPSPRHKRGRPVVVAPFPSKSLCAEEETTGLEPMTDVVSLQPLEESEIEPAESTASEEATQSASPAQPSPRQKRGRTVVVAPVPSKSLCAEEETTEESEIEPAENTASEEAAQSASPAQPSPRQKRGRPVVVSPVPSKSLCAEEETTAAVTVSDVDEQSSSALDEKPSELKVLRKKQLKQAMPVGAKQTKKEADVPEGSCEADEETAKEPVKVAVSPGKGKASVTRRQSARAVRK